MAIPTMSDEPDIIRPGRGKLADVETAGLSHNGAGKTFFYTDRLGQESEGFLMRWNDTLVAYQNLCPHWSIPIGEDHFLDESGRSIFCPMHGALFDPENGVCFSGPCLGDRLTPFEVRSSAEEGVVEIWAKNQSLFA